MTHQPIFAAAGEHEAIRLAHLPAQLQGRARSTNLHAEITSSSRQLPRTLIEDGPSAELGTAQLELCRLFPDESFLLGGNGFRAQGLKFAALLMVFAVLVGTIVMRSVA
jgi:hypothetical protein